MSDLAQSDESLPQAPAASAARADRVNGGDATEQAMEIYIAGVRLVADCAGALYWPEERALIVADLHLEKGSSYAARGVLLPPYDTAATLARLARLIARYAPRAVIALGDSFHDGEGPMRLADSGSRRAVRAAARPRLALGRRQSRSRSVRPGGRQLSRRRWRSAR